METIYCEKLLRILKNKKRLEEKLEIKISNRGKEITLDGNSEKEYVAKKVIEALEFGFPFSVAMFIVDEDFMFEIVNIKEYTKRKDLERIRARIIGKQGRALKTLSQLTKCFFELKGNQIGIIGHPEHIKNAEDAITSIIRGSKHSNVYSHLEKHQPKPIYDLGLKE